MVVRGISGRRREPGWKTTACPTWTLTGNLPIIVQYPALYLRDTGAGRDPWRGPGRPRGTLRGPPAARVVRALIDFAAPVTVPELVRRSGASTGATYRVVEFLEREGMIERAPRGPNTGVEWHRGPVGADGPSIQGSPGVGMAHAWQGGLKRRRPAPQAEAVWTCP